MAILERLLYIEVYVVSIQTSVLDCFMQVVINGGSTVYVTVASHFVLLKLDNTLLYPGEVCCGSCCV